MTDGRDPELTSPYGDNNHPLPRGCQQPKTWGEMTDAEKGALLLAHHDGLDIECYQQPSYGWLKLNNPVFDDTSAYRVRPEPKEKRVRCSRQVLDYFSNERGTCIERDGKVDWSTWEAE